MPTETGAVFLGLLLSLTNFALFATMSAIALRRDTVVASAIMIGGLMVRLGIITAVYLALVNSPVWEPRIYYVTAGFVPSLTVLIVVEIFMIMRMGDRVKQ